MPQSPINSTSIGLFGKLPTNGDFIHRDLPTSFVSIWDHWLQTNLAFFQSQDTENWLSSYLTSPIWRFLIPPSLVNEQAYFGILAPSVDKVGRYFPFTFAASLPDSHAGSVLCEPFQNILTLLESCFLTHLHSNNSNLEHVDQDLNIINNKLNQLVTSQSFDPLPENLDSHQFIISNKRPLSESASCLWLSSMLQRYSNSSIWWTKGSQTVEPSLLFTQGLPSKQQFSAMLSSFQNNTEWRQKHLVSANMYDNELSSLMSSLTQPSATSEPSTIAADNESPNAIVTPPTELESDDAVSGLDILSNFQNSDVTSEQNISNMTDNSKTQAALFNIQSFGFSDVGNKRTQNQDAILVKDSDSLWLVADGMGGHFDGDKASQEIVKQLSGKDLPVNLFSKVDAIKQTIQNVNTEIFSYAKDNQLTCGSTVVLLALENNKATFLWAGDSRLYLWRCGELTQLSSDHSMYNLYKESGLSTENIQNNAITRAVGVDENIDLDIGFQDLAAGDRLMLCSDGLHDPAGDESIKYALSLDTPESAAEHLKSTVLAGEAKDNLSGVFIWL
jgi:type VI secretion system ImpM family protein